MFLALGRLGGSSLRGTNRFSSSGYAPSSSVPINKQSYCYSMAATPTRGTGTDLSMSLSASISPHTGLDRSALYVLGDKNQMKVGIIFM